MIYLLLGFATGWIIVAVFWRLKYKNWGVTGAILPWLYWRVRLMGYTCRLSGGSVTFNRPPGKGWMVELEYVVDFCGELSYAHYRVTLNGVEIRCIDG